MSGANGLKTAVELAGGIGDLGLGGEVQPELFADADDAPMPMPAAKGVSGPKGGRPRGARNRSTEEWRRFILSKYRSPLVFLMELQARTPRELARQLELYKYHEGRLVLAPVLDANGVQLRDADGELRWSPVLDTGAAFSAQKEAAIAAAKYLHQAMPQALEVKSETRGLVLLGNFDAKQAAELGFGLPLAPEQNQQVIDAEDVKSDDVQSDGKPNPLEHNDDVG